jgi:putative nucleotidyltransferase with HDIG domain
MLFQNRYQVTQYDLSNLKQWFYRYVQSFYSSDSDIQQAIVFKEKHSFMVCEEIRNIGKQLKLSHNNLRLAEVMALFHDIGRFEQFNLYHTFSDSKSEDHARLGVKVLQQQHTLAALNPETQELILKSISNHNRLAVPGYENHICVYFSKLLRDADKLDIFNLVLSYFDMPTKERSAAVGIDLPDTPAISEEIINSIREGKMIRKQKLCSLNDFKLFQMAWIYDINFQPTFQMIVRRDYLKRIKNTLPVSDEIDQIYCLLLNHLKKCAEAGNSKQYPQTW